MNAWVGTSGWHYQHWGEGVFYPKRLSHRGWLGYYSRHFETVELNNSFYRLPSAETFEGWRTKTPEGFLFALKASRFITHVKKLHDIEDPLNRFLENASALREKLGPLLFQFPPSWVPDLERLETLFRVLSKQKIVPSPKIAVEVRNRKALVPPFFELLSRYGVSLCLADWRDLRIESPLTAPMVFLRRHGGPGGGYSNQKLRADAEKIKRWLAEEREVFVYFNNDIGGRAVRNAKTLLRYLQAA
jgi:uncharacterized protein YecE (DUF72 family)